MLSSGPAGPPRRSRVLRHFAGPRGLEREGDRHVSGGPQRHGWSVANFPVHLAERGGVLFGGREPGLVFTAPSAGDPSWALEGRSGPQPGRPRIRVGE